MSEAKKQSRGIKDITPQRLYDLNCGAETTNLIECLAVDFSQLIQNVLPDLNEKSYTEIKAQSHTGISKRMRLVAELIMAEYGSAIIEKLSKHSSDTVRGWGCFMIGQRTGLTLLQRLEAIKPLADDHHFGVREWSWMAIRNDLSQDIQQAVNLLQVWAQNRSAYLRRFAIESLRPRGVWCAHIGILKQDPQIALPLLEALKDDPSVYVQDSVANWLNDASKDRADWVRGLCSRWMENSPTRDTQRICKRAMRSIQH